MRATAASLLLGLGLSLGLSLGFSLVAASATAGSVEDGIVSAFDRWMDTAGIETGAIAVTRKGRLVTTHGRNMDPGAPMEMASLSKAVTGVCLRRLAGEGILALDDRLGDFLPETPPVMADLTLAELLSQTSGLHRDSTQETMPGWLGAPAPRHDEVAAAVFARNRTKRRGTYRYNNENYALLGAVIARSTGRPYAEVCKPEVPGAELSPLAGAFDSWGGWRMPVADYAAFHARAFTNGPDPAGEPFADLGGGARYGLGTFWREFRGGHNFWHFGALCFDTLGSGSFAVSWQGDWGVVAAWESCVDFDVMGQLDAALIRAVFPR